MATLRKKYTLNSEFIILGSGDLTKLQIVFFGLFLIMHLVTLAQHTAIVLITLVDFCLQTPFTICPPLKFAIYRSLSPTCWPVSCPAASGC